jgi:hypothetical protein
MMMMTRTDALLEVTPASGPRLALKIDRIRSASLIARREDTGRLSYALVLDQVDGSPPHTMPGSMEMLSLIHARIAEIMSEIEAIAPQRPDVTFSADEVRSWSTTN